MGPSQAVDVSCQAFTPEGTNFVRNKIVEPTTRQDTLFWEQVGQIFLICTTTLAGSHFTHPASLLFLIRVNGVALMHFSNRITNRFSFSWSS